jgi:predicted phosphoadenosine phosphosulfate sulfurtransferase
MTLHKEYEERNVYEAALDRFRTLYDRFDKVVISFSGGKDSTVCLQLALQVAHERNRLPLDVYYWDEEAIPPETNDYVRRVGQRPDVRLKWLCIPIRHRNACSRTQPWWHPWNPKEEHLWVYPLPPEAQTEMDGFYWGAQVPDIAYRVYGPEHGLIADVRGLRADESMRRYRAVTSRVKDNWIAGPKDRYCHPVSPIYDWTTMDVWTAPRLFGWDYNRAYDIYAMAGISLAQQRVCPPFGEEPLERLWCYAQCWPDLWHRMLKRVHGAATAGRYARTELYGYGTLKRPPGLSWRDWTWQLLDLYPPDLKAAVASSVKRCVTAHQAKTRRPIPEEAPDLLTGISWKFLAQIANRGDLKGRKSAGMIEKANMARIRLGLEPLKDYRDADALSRY